MPTYPISKLSTVNNFLKQYFQLNNESSHFYLKQPCQQTKIRCIEFYSFLQTGADYKLLKNVMRLLKWVEFLCFLYAHIFLSVLKREKPNLFYKINTKAFLDEMLIFYFGLLLRCACFPLSLLVNYIQDFNANPFHVG